MTRTAIYAFCLVVLLLAVGDAVAETKPEADTKVKYSSFKELARTEKPGVDFKVVYRPGSRLFLIAAPHGGGIEPGSSEIAEAIAGNTHGLYLFHGLKRDASVLFVPSVSFDEPELARVTKTYGTIIAVHVIPGSDRLIYVGGKNRQLADAIMRALTTAGFDAKPLTQSSTAFATANLINKTAVGGVQIELSSAVVDGMFRGPVTNERVRTDPTRRTGDFNRFVKAARDVLERRGGESSGVRIHSKDDETRGRR